MGLVPQRVLNAYSKDSPGAGVNGTYEEGDFLIRFTACDESPMLSCEQEMMPYYNIWTKKTKTGGGR